MKTAFVLGGTGFVGRHLALRLAEGGWDVTVGSRGESPLPDELGGLRHARVDRFEEGSLARALAGGVDVFVDVIAYEIADARRVLSVRDLAGGVVVISTASVYADDAGRTLDEATSAADFPVMPVPIPETQRRATPGDATYSTKKVAIEDMLLGQDDVPAALIRPCAIYGPGDTKCREWYFVKRVLDGRRRVLLADRGESRFHTTSVHNLAEIVRLAAEARATGAFNCGDPDPPDVRRIAASIARALGHEWEEVLLDRSQPMHDVVASPWGAPSPWLIDMTKAAGELGYEPVTTYEDAIGETVEWVTSAVSGADWREVLPKAVPHLGDAFDYAAEDELLRALG